MELKSLEEYLVKSNCKYGWVYDIESYPNYFCVTFYREKQIKQFEIGFEKNQLKELLIFVKGKVLVGYNNLNFDDLILNYLDLCKDNFSNLSIEKINELIFNCAQKVVQSHNRNNQGQLEDIVKKIKYYKKNYSSLDLMRVGNFQKSLKALGISLKHHKIQDLPLPWNEPIRQEDTKEVLSYNINDTEITYKLLRKLEQEIDLRYNLSIEYDIFMLNDSDSAMANKLLEKFYKDELGSDIDFDSLRTSREDIPIKDCISSDVNFKTRKMNFILKNLKEIILLKENKYSFKFPKIEYKNKEYQLGVGGLHSNDTAQLFRPDDEYLIIDADVASYYPAIMINQKIKPHHLGDEFFRILNDLRASRLIYKKEGNKVKSNGLKIVINSLFGKMGFGGSFLYDQLACYRVTVNGQLFLLMLIEDLEEAGFEVISANTDGIVTKVNRTRESEYYQICQAWSDKLSFDLEYTYYDIYVRRDVNNYLAVDKTGEVKSKGAFLQYIDLNKGYKYPVLRNALYEYFVKNVDYREYFRNHKDILDFCMSEKVGAQFHTVLYGDEKIQKSVRYYPSIEGKKLYKIKSDDSGNDAYHDLCAERLVTVINDYEDKEDYKIDYSFYEDEIKKIIDEVEIKKSEMELLF